VTDPINVTTNTPAPQARVEETDPGKRSRPVGVPSNAVYARVGDTVQRAAQEGVRRGLQPQDIIREIAAKHDIRLNIGELRLLLAARRVPN
jgi:hypothetical protein